ncbi:Hypothetical predicted protein [Paramuricea clavata]|uniref:Uncharacterized protein n=1 Tax=Paramuricea clavata TaxID=317549 RepID=A0A7D9HJB2_PARCT|nr:Hypothetical predicted protein [Paramuricea clavata]
MVMRNVHEAPDQSLQANAKPTPPAKRKLLPTPPNEGRKKQRQELPEPETPEGSQTSDIDNVIAMADSDTSLIGMSTPRNDLEKLAEKNRRLKNQVISLQASVKEKNNKLRQMKRKVINEVTKLRQHVHHQPNDQESMEDVSEESENETVEENDHEDTTDPHYEMEDDGGHGDSELDESDDESELLTMEKDNLRTEPKHIVFLSQLLLLFSFCHSCKTDNPLIETREVGTKAVVTTICSNPKCPKKITTWHSQPMMPGTKISAGNFLLCMAVLLAGSSISKARQVFLHMGLGCVSLNTYFRYQRTMLFPTIYLHWRKYQNMLIETARNIKGGVVLAGDGRHDSMGHSAKFCAYTMFCCTLGKIIHFDLVQRNQAGSSPAMEFMSFKSCMDYLIKKGLAITTFISDRHTSVAKYMRSVLSKITHYFDIWHLKKTYVQEIYLTYLMAGKKELKDAAIKLKEMSPAPMDSVFNKQAKAEALKKRADRSEMVVKDVPPTTPVSEVLAQASKTKKNTIVRYCKTCKNPMKGHKKVKECPRNQKS